MKKILFIFLSLSIFGCEHHDVFNGNLSFVSSENDTITITADTIAEGMIYSHYFAVNDTLAIFYNPYDRNFMFSIYNMQTNSELGKFVPRGHGNKEVLTVMPVNEIHTDDSKTGTYLYAPNEQIVIHWNISESLQKMATVYDDTIEYKNPNDGCPVGYSQWYLMGKDHTLVHRTSVHISDNNTISPDLWQIRDFPDTTLVCSFQLFDVIFNSASMILPEDFFSMFTSIKPDNTKFAGAMCWLPQINIVDVEIGKVHGILLDGMANYEVFKTDMNNAKYYYADIQSNDDFIFALWCGEQTATRDRTKGLSIIHVLDWNGNIRKIGRLASPVDKIYLDRMNGLIYGYRDTNGSLYRYRLADLGI